MASFYYIIEKLLRNDLNLSDDTKATPRFIDIQVEPDFECDGCGKMQRSYPELTKTIMSSPLTHVPFCLLDTAHETVPDETAIRTFYLLALTALDDTYTNYCVCALHTKRFSYLSRTYTNVFNSTYKHGQLALFSYANKAYKGFMQLARIYKYRTANVHNTCDLIGEPFPASATQFPWTWKPLVRSTHKRKFDEIGQGPPGSKTYTKSEERTRDCALRGFWNVWQHGSLYTFSQRDLIQLIHSALSHSCTFFPKPLPICNPYNKVEFKDHDLYNIYHFLRHGSMKIPHLIHLFYASRFDIDNLMTNYEDDLREACIYKYCINESDDEICEMVIEMTENCAKWMDIDIGFPKDALARALRPYLYLYLCTRYCKCTGNKYSRLLKQKLREFRSSHAGFGRKKFDMSKKPYKVSYTTDFLELEWKDIPRRA